MARLCLTILLAAFFFSVTAVCSCRAGMFDVSDTDEKEMGKQVADSIIQQYGIVVNKAENERLETVGAALVTAAGKNSADYHFYIIDTEMVNAFALPGGYIFATKGMMDFVDDDDELAAVMGHEIVHIVRKHGITLYKKGMKTMVVNLLLLLLTKDPNAVIANEMYQQGRSELFGRKAELESDHYEMDYMRDSGYDPVAQVRLMQKLEKLEMHRPPVFEGYFDVHPPTDQRVQTIKKHLREMNIDPENNSKQGVNERTHAAEQCDETICTGAVWRKDKEIFVFTSERDGLTPYQRALDASIALNEALDEGIEIYDIKTIVSGDSAILLCGEKEIAAATPGDALSAGISTEELAAQWAKQLKNIIWTVTITDGF